MNAVGITRREFCRASVVANRLKTYPDAIKKSVFNPMSWNVQWRFHEICWPNNNVLIPMGPWDFLIGFVFSVDIEWFSLDDVRMKGPFSRGKFVPALDNLCPFMVTHMKNNGLILFVGPKYKTWENIRVRVCFRKCSIDFSHRLLPSWIKTRKQRYWKIASHGLETSDSIKLLNGKLWDNEVYSRRRIKVWIRKTLIRTRAMNRMMVVWVLWKGERFRELPPEIHELIMAFF